MVTVVTAPIVHNRSSMRIIVGDEVGLVKVVTFDSKNRESDAQPTVTTFGSVDRAKAVDQLQWIDKHTSLESSQRMIGVGRHDGVIDVISVDSGSVVKSISVNGSHETRQNERFFVGLHSVSDQVAYGTSTGCVAYRKFDENEDTVRSVKVAKSLARMCVHPQESNLFAAGGKDQNLILRDMERAVDGAVDPIFKAKNGKPDNLGLQPPIWITDVEFLLQDRTIVTSTGYGQIRVYDIKHGRRPVLDYGVGSNPILSMAVHHNQHQVICTDNVGTISCHDLRTGKLLHRYKGCTGAVTDIAVPSTECPSFLASTSIDRFLRVHQLAGNRALQHRVYLKQRMTCLLIDNDFIDRQNSAVRDGREEEETEDSMWNAMSTVRDDTPSKKKPRTE